MKTGLFALVTGLLMLSSCKKASDSTPAITLTAVNTTVVTGSWKVTYYYDKTFDATASFSGYSFTFASGGTITAVKGASTVNGTWSSGNDDSKVKFVISFATPANFTEISNDWHVIERTDTKIRLQDISGGGGGTEFLTFERN